MQESREVGITENYGLGLEDFEDSEKANVEEEQVSRTGWWKDGGVSQQTCCLACISRDMEVLGGNLLHMRVNK